jgi:hypothetical protein
VPDAGDDPEAASHCPNCGAEYRAGFATCSDCGFELAPGPAPRPEPAKEQKLNFYDELDMRNFGRTFDMFEQEQGRPVAIAIEGQPELGLLIERLESEGIGARPGPMDTREIPASALVMGGGVAGGVAGMLSPWERWVVLVREPNTQRAKEIYERFDQLRRGSDDGSLDYPPDDEDARHSASPNDAWDDANRRVWGSSQET